MEITNLLEHLLHKLVTGVQQILRIETSNKFQLMYLTSTGRERRFDFHQDWSNIDIFSKRESSFGRVRRKGGVFVDIELEKKSTDSESSPFDSSFF